MAYWCTRGWRFNLVFLENLREATVTATLQRDGWEYVPVWDSSAGWYCPQHIGWARRRAAIAVMRAELEP